MDDNQKQDRRSLAATDRQGPRRRATGAAARPLSPRAARAIAADATLDFAACLRALRSRAGLSQIDLADRTGLTRVAISHWETGMAVPREAAARRLEAVFRLPVNALRRAMAKSLSARTAAVRNGDAGHD